jgi:hypothetical protein
MGFRKILCSGESPPSGAFFAADCHGGSEELWVVSFEGESSNRYVTRTSYSILSCSSFGGWSTIRARFGCLVVQ